MDALYDATILLATTLLAVTIPVFVFAVSLLGRAIEKSREDLQQAESAAKDEIAQQIEKAKDELSKAQKKEDIQRLKRQLEKLQKEMDQSEQRLKEIVRLPELLTVKGSVVIPGVLFLIPILLSAYAKLLTQISEDTLNLRSWNITDWVALLLWVAASVPLIGGIKKLYASLKAVQEVAITTEAAQFKRMVEALKSALAEHEEVKRPKLAFIWGKQQPPFKFPKNFVVTISYTIVLTSGDIARGVEVWFFAPPVFTFPDQRSWQQDSNFSIPNAVTIKKKQNEDLKAGIKYWGDVEIKTPDKEGSYELAYQLLCEGFKGPLEKFDVRIE